MASNSRNKLHQTWSAPLSEALYRHRFFLDESPDSRYMCTNSGVWGLSSEASRPVSLQIYNFACTLNVSLLSPTVGQTQKTTARGLSQSLTSYVCVNQSLPGVAPAFPADLIFSGVLNA